MSLTRIGSPVLGLDDGVFDVLRGGHQSHGAHVDLLQARFDEAPAGVDVVVGELLLHLADAQPVGHQFVRIDANLVFAGDPSEAGHVHHVGHGLELLLEHPVLQRLQLHDVVLRVRADQRGRSRSGRPGSSPCPSAAAVPAAGSTWESRSRTFWRFKSLSDSSSKISDDAGEAEQRHGAQVRQVRDAVHHGFERNGDLLLHFLGGAARPLGDHLT